MISIGDNILSNPVGDALHRQQEYAKALGHIDMIVFSPKSNNLQEKHYKNISIYPTKSLNMITFVQDVIRIAKKIIKEKKIDVITTQDPFGTALAGYILKNKYDIALHIQNHSCFLDNKEWISEKPLLFSIFNKLSYFTLKKADRLRVVNRAEKQKYIDILGIDKDKIDVAPVPVNIEFWQYEITQKDKDDFVEKYNIDKTKPILSWAGRVVKFKNIPYLFKSIAKVNSEYKVNFLVAGDMKNSYIDLAKLEKELNIKPIYLGLLTHEELKIMYYLTDIYLHTSNYEGFGLVVSDAQACGTIVLSRYTAGTSDIIDDKKSGFLIDGNSDKFSQKIVELLKTKQYLNMGKYAKDMMKMKFNSADMFKDILNSIKKSILNDK